MSGILQAVAPLTHAEFLSNPKEQRLVMQLVLLQMSQNYQLWVVSVKREANNCLIRLPISN